MCGNGTFADLAIFSFHPVKHIATGEGGMITTNSKELYDKLLLLRTHGITKDNDLLIENHGPWYYEMQELGYNYRLTDFQAALGLSQLKRADDGVHLRNTIAKVYDDAFESIPQIKLPFRSDEVFHAFHLYVIQIEDRLGLFNYLRAHNIFAQIHYIPVHLMPYYKKLGCKRGNFPIAEAYYDRCLSLPMFPFMTDEELDFVINKINDFFN